MKHKKRYNKDIYKYSWNGKIFGIMVGVHDDKHALYKGLEHEIQIEINREVIKSLNEAH